MLWTVLDTQGQYSAPNLAGVFADIPWEVPRLPEGLRGLVAFPLSS